MLDPDFVTNSIVASLQSITELATELGAPDVPVTESIIGHIFYGGKENAIARALAQMKSPSVLVGYLDMVMGNFDGMTLWKHRLLLCTRARNAAANGSAASAPHLWQLCMNYPISVPQVAGNIRYVDLANGLLWMQEGAMKYKVDELGQDFFVNLTTWNEMGDAGPDGVDLLCIGPAESRFQFKATVSGFAHAITQHLSVEEQLQLFEKVAERNRWEEMKEEAANGVTHTE